MEEYLDIHNSVIPKRGCLTKNKMEMRGSGKCATFCSCFWKKTPLKLCACHSAKDRASCHSPHHQTPAHSTLP